MDVHSNTTLKCAVCSQAFAFESLIDVGGYPTCKSCLEQLSREIGERRQKLYKLKKDKYVAGVCGGLADLCNMDREVFRIIAFFAILFTGVIPGVIAYIVLAFILPTRDR